MKIRATIVRAASAAALLAVLCNTALAAGNEPAARASGGAIVGVVNVNSATAEELALLPGVGPAKAQAILEYRKEHGAFKRVEDLAEVKGIGDKLASRLIVELKGRLPDEIVAGKGSEAASLEKDATSALVALGYDPAQAGQAVRKARRDLGADAKVEDVIRRSLSHV